MPMGARLRSVRREQGTVPWTFHLMSWLMIGWALRIYHRLRVTGCEHLPKEGPFVLVSNHASHLDTLVLGGCLPWRLRPDSFPIAAGDTFFKKSGTALLSAYLMNALPIWRRSNVTHTLRDLRERLATQRCIYIVFPEGTRTRDGDMGKFKSGLGMIVAGTATPVVPCSVTGTFAAMPPKRRFPKPYPIQVKIGPPLRFDSICNDRRGWDEIAIQTETAVKSLDAEMPH